MNNDLPNDFLGQKVELTEIRLGHLDAFVPETIRQAWQRFLAEYRPGDEIWTFHRAYPEPATSNLRQRQGWAGFAILRHGQIVNCFEI